MINDGPTMIQLIFKTINPDTSIGVSKIKYEIEKTNLAKFGNNVKDLIDDIYPNYSIIIDKGERYENYVSHIFRALLSGPNSTFNFFHRKDEGRLGHRNRSTRRRTHPERY